MLIRNEVYLEGYGCPFGLIYFYDDQAHIGMIKIALFFIMIIFWIMVNLNSRLINFALGSFVIEMAWNFLILCDCFFFLHYPKDFQGISWTPSKSLQNRIYSEKAISKQDSFFMMFGYMIYLIMILPFVYFFLFDKIQLLMNKKKEDKENFPMAEHLI